MPLMYELLDMENKTLASVDYSYDMTKDHFEIYDANHLKLGATNEYLFRFYPEFYVYQKDSQTPSVRGEMNFWGTTFSIYDIETGNQFAQMTRSYWRKANYWHFNVTDNDLFKTIHFDPALLTSVIAIQTDAWLYQTSHSASLTGVNALSDNNNKGAAMVRVRQQAFERVKEAQLKLGMQQPSEQPAEVFERVEKKLAKDFANTHSTVNQLSKKASFELFLQYCLDCLESDQLSDEEKQTLLLMLQKRFQ